MDTFIYESWFKFVSNILKTKNISSWKSLSKVREMRILIQVLKVDRYGHSFSTRVWLHTHNFMDSTNYIYNVMTHSRIWTNHSFSRLMIRNWQHRWTENKLYISNNYVEAKHDNNKLWLIEYILTRYRNIKHI
jgi:hypothetical protein